LKDEELVARLLEAVVDAVDVPVTLKIRTGWDAQNRNGVRIAQIAEAAGIQALAVHGRTREDFYTGDAEYDTIRAIKSAVTIPVFANGDIDEAQKARDVLDFTRADGVMIGRGAHGAPWIFRAVNSHLQPDSRALTAEKSSDPLSREEVRAIILAHLEALYAFYGEDTGVRVARKHLGWYFASLPDSATVRASLMAPATTALQFAAAKGHLDGWVEHEATRCDVRVA
jgi:tRNA-dihydrouridine synthase B